MNFPSSSGSFVVIFLLFDVQPRDNFIFVMDNLIFVENRGVKNTENRKKAVTNFHHLSRPTTISVDKKIL